MGERRRGEFVEILGTSKIHLWVSPIRLIMIRRMEVSFKKGEPMVEGGGGGKREQENYRHFRVCSSAVTFFSSKKSFDILQIINSPRKLFSRHRKIANYTDEDQKSEMIIYR